MIPQDVEPRNGRVKVDTTVARRLGDAAFGDEHGESRIKRVEQLPLKVVAMGCRIEVQRVHDVVEFERVARGIHEVAVKGRGAHDDDGPRTVFADDGDDLLGVGLHIGPGGLAVWLVADLVDHVGDACIFAADLVEEGLSLLEVLIGIVVLKDMPVHQHIHVVCDAGVDAPVQHLQVFLLVTLAIVLRVHGEAHQVAVPLACQLREELRVHVLRVPLQAVGAHAAQHHGVSLRVAELGSDDLQSAGGGGAVYLDQRLVALRCLGALRSLGLSDCIGRQGKAPHEHEQEGKGDGEAPQEPTVGSHEQFLDSLPFVCVVCCRSVRQSAMLVTQGSVSSMMARYVAMTLSPSGVPSLPWRRGWPMSLTALTRRILSWAATISSLVRSER